MPTFLRRAAILAAIALPLVAHAAPKNKNTTQGAAVATPVPAPLPPADPSNCAFTDIDAEKWGMRDLQDPPELRAVRGHLRTTLSVQYTDPKTTSIGGCPVTLRSYNGQLVGPTLRVRPGETLDVLLDNKLPLETPNEAARQVKSEADSAFIETTPASFNTTNLHTHGLHVSPVGNSDNVLLSIEPQSKFQFEVRVPENHPSGSFWYHPHTHGSTSIQVGSGMEGMLIIDDDPARLPASLRAARERVMVFQTTLYDAQGKVDDITSMFPGPNEQDCKEGKSSCTWPSSHRRVTINGQIVPIIRMRPGEVQRWRMLDASFRETLTVRLEGHSLSEIALDGLYTGTVDTWGPTQTVELEPGYRSDVVVKASSTPGTYKLIDTQIAKEKGLRGIAESERVLALVVIEGRPLDMPLPTAAEMASLAPFPGLDLSKQATGVQEVSFKLGGSPVEGQANKNYFQVNYQAFNPANVRYLRLGATDLWHITTVGDPPNGIPSSNAVPPLPHVFHIHVNPFQTTRAAPDGSTETVWRDTLLIPAGANVTLYSQYTDYIGQYVLHCHILDHEDLGMMQIVEVVQDSPSSSVPNRGHGH